jgi:putative salt-induced outer membrane protein YdiY
MDWNPKLLGRAAGVALWVCLLPAFPAFAQEVAEDAETAQPAAPKWSGRFDLGLALTEGNSNSEAFNLKGRIERQLERTRLRFKAEGINTDTADDRVRLVEPGVTWLPGEVPPVEEAATSIVDPAIEPDVEQYFLELLLERTLKKDPKRGAGKLKWHSGISWDRNVEAGLTGRTVGFAGFGHDWWDREDLGFRTRYGLSYTHRNERTKDPEKDEDFAGVRFSWFYHNKWGPRVEYENDLTYNLSLVDSSDYSLTMTQSLDVPMSQRLSLVVSLRWQYNNFPALEDIDVVAEVVIRDPDGIPGSGDEFFETVAGGGTHIDIGTIRERKKDLDTVLSTSLRITF